jgi:hypothetical protein
MLSQYGIKAQVAPKLAVNALSFANYAPGTNSRYTSTLGAKLLTIDDTNPDLNFGTANARWCSRDGILFVLRLDV